MTIFTFASFRFLRWFSPRWFAPALGLALLMPVGAVAQNSGHSHGASLDARELGREHGYRDGYHHGQEDRDRNLGFEYNGNDYKRGDVGYEKYMGSKGQYKKGYRDSYKQGYEDGYRGNAGSFGEIYGRSPYPDNGNRPSRDNPSNTNPNNTPNNPNDDIWGPNPDHSRDDVYSSRGWNVHDVAYDFGYKDGVYYAQRDMSNRRSANAEETKGYKDADHGYQSSYNKDEYKRFYREGFLRGYNDEYRRR